MQLEHEYYGGDERLPAPIAVGASARHTANPKGRGLVRCGRWAAMHGALRGAVTMRMPMGLRTGTGSLDLARGCEY